MRRVLVLILFATAFSFSNGQKIAGPLTIEPGIGLGFTLFAPLTSNTTYLIDNCGRVINTWESNYFPGNTAYIMPNGNLLRTYKLPNSVITGGGGSGGVEMFDWDGNRIWFFELNNDSLRMHHDVSYLPNGNVLILIWELRKGSEVLAVGGDPARIPANDVIWSEQILELKPNTNSGTTEIVWKWSLWDHLVQDFDNSKPGFGVVSDHPELMDINFISDVTSDWIHANSIDFNEELNQIVISSPFLNELWIIDHSTSTAEAASHVGGLSGKGGDFLYRWGNPQAYKRGTSTDQKLFFQHDVSWIEDGSYKGKIILFNNRKGSDFSSVDIIEPPLNANNYVIGSGAFGPASPVLEYTATVKQDLYSQNMSSAQALPNGNLFICSSRQSFIFEVNPTTNFETWRYKSPVTSLGIVGRDYFTTDPDFNNDVIFRAKKYNYDYAGFMFRDLKPKEPIEGEPWAPCDLVTAVEESIDAGINFFPNPVVDKLYITGESGVELTASLFDMQGREVLNRKGKEKLEFDLTKFNTGMYLLRLNNKTHKIMKIGE